jgi:hypothetical protein
MANFANLQITNAGITLLTGDLTGRTLIFTKMEAGDGSITDDSVIPAMTALVAPKADIPITKIVDKGIDAQGRGIVQLTGVLSSANVTTGFWFRELGIDAQLDNGTPVLFDYSNAYTQVDYIPSSGESSQVIQSITADVIISRSVPTQAVIGSSTDIDAINIGPPSVGPGFFAQKVGLQLQFKRLIPGPSIQVSEDANTVTVGLRSLTADIDLYVAPGNPDISPNFSTIQNAWNYLLGWDIPAGKSARINVAEGVYTQNATLSLSHRQGTQISILGPDPVIVPITAMPSVWATSGANNWSAAITIQDASKIQVNDVVSFFSGGGNYTWDGAHRVINKVGNVITILMPSPRNLTLTGHVSPTLRWYPARLQSGATNYGHMVSIGTLGVRQIKGISFLHRRDTAKLNYTVIIGGGCTANFLDCAFCRGDAYHMVVGGVLTCERVFLGDCTHGIYLGTGSSLTGQVSTPTTSPARDLVSICIGSMGAGQAGGGEALWVAAGEMWCYNLRCVSNGAAGVISSGDGIIWPSYNPVTNLNYGQSILVNNNIGVQCADGGRMRFDFGTCTGNSTADLYAANLGQTMLTNYRGAPTYGTTSPPINTEGNNHAYVIRIY